MTYHLYLFESILQNGPEAISDTKRIIFEVMNLEIDDGLAVTLATDHARKRRTKEALEGLTSFGEKREAKWYPKK